MAFYQFKQQQKISASVQEVWDFISSPVNLREITPAYLGFVVTSDGGAEKMYAGMIITYIVRPLLGIPLKWMTEIKQVKEREFFVDEQRIGPYRLWHHQHRLVPVEGGVLMTDIVTYAPPFGFIGAWANRLFVRRQLDDIFRYRRSAIEKRFPGRVQSCPHPKTR